MKAILIFTAIVSTALATEIPVWIDATVGSVSADGSGPTLQVGGGFRSYLSFSSQQETFHVPSTNIASATIKLWVSRVTTPGFINVYAAASAWDEVSITPANAPAQSVNLGVVAVTAKSNSVVIDISGITRIWRDFPSQEFGIVLLPSSGTPDVNVQFDSKENALTSHAASLSVSFNGPAGPIGPVGPNGDPGAPGPAGNPGADGAGMNLQWKSASYVRGPGDNALATAVCGIGQKAISGGCVVLNDPAGSVRLYFHFLESFYFACESINEGTVAKTVVASVLCTK
jgi:hypothetical protein